MGRRCRFLAVNVQETREALVDCYLDAFRKTHLIMLLTDEKTNKYGLSKRDVGWRIDYLGDLGGYGTATGATCTTTTQKASSTSA